MRVTKELIDSAWDKVFDNVIDVEIRLFDEVTDSVVPFVPPRVHKALKFQLSKSVETAEEGAEVSVYRRIFHIRVGLNNASEIALNVGDKIVDLSETGNPVYEIEKVELQSWGTRWRCETILLSKPPTR